MEKRQYLGATVDAEAARLLAAIAKEETENNKSMTLRRIIREAAAARGMCAPAPAPTRQTAQTTN